MKHKSLHGDEGISHLRAVSNLNNCFLNSGPQASGGSFHVDDKLILQGSTTFTSCR